MSLQTDLIFYDALSADTELMTTIGNRLYCDLTTKTPRKTIHLRVAPTK